MIRNAIVICISLYLSQFLLAAQGENLLAFEEKWFYSASEQEKLELMIAKFEYQLLNPQFIPGIYSTMERIDAELISDSTEKACYLWDAALFCLIDEREQQGMNYLNKYQKFTNDTLGDSQLLKVLLKFPYNPEESKMMYQSLVNSDSVFAGLECFFDVSLYNNKNLNYYVIASAIVPGSGIIAQGKALKGLTSMGLNAGSVALAIVLWREQLFVNSILWGGMLFSKFYPGQLLLTESVFEQRILRKKEKLANECELLCGPVLNRLKFRIINP